MATTLGITNTIDYKRNLKNHRPYIETTNLNINSYKIKTILDFWGSGVAAVNNNIYGYNRFDSSDAPIMIAHGTNDQTVLYSEAPA
jgi:hypothetical protein